MKRGIEMAKLDCVTYIEEVMDEAHLEFDWMVQWNKRQTAVEIFCSIFAEVDLAETVIEDVEGTVTENDIIEFEDVIIFYDPKKTTLDLADYLVAIPFDSKKWIEKGLIDAVIKQLRIVMTEGQSDLLDFATDPTIETFELNWNEADFKGTLDTYRETGRYNTELAAYPKF